VQNEETHVNRNDPASYYSFDDDAREVIIKRYDCPTPWLNYLSNGTFHTMLSQAGGGLAWYKSPQIWRINRYRFYHLPTDRSGMYLYIRDKDTGTYWCPTAEPAQKKPSKWQAAHGLGYTRFEAEEDGIRAHLRYIVGPDENCLIWNLELQNTGNKPKKLDLFAFVEFGMMEYLREVSWCCYMKHQMSVWHNPNADSIVFKYGVETQPKPAETPLVYLAADQPLTGFDGSRDEFIGAYRSETDPYVLDSGTCTNSTLFGGDPCGALQMAIHLNPGQSKTVNVFLGTAMTENDIGRALQHCRKPNFVEHAFRAVQESWGDYLSAFQCELPDTHAQRQINVWNPYQAQRNFQFSRNISFYATGTFRGVGFRDTAQDILAQAPMDQASAKDKIRLLLGQQHSDGHVNHYFFPTEGWEPLDRLHSDNHLWPILAAWNTVMEEGSTAFLDETMPYFDKGKATVYEHLRQGLHFTLSKLGPHGLPLMLHSDWNDQMFKVCRKGLGESFWTSMQLGVVLPKIIELAKLSGHETDIPEYQNLRTSQKELINTIGWDGAWFRRAIMDNGLFLGDTPR